MHRILFYGLFAGSKNPYSLDRYSVDAPCPFTLILTRKFLRLTNEVQLVFRRC